MKPFELLGCSYCIYRRVAVGLALLLAAAGPLLRAQDHQRISARVTFDEVHQVFRLDGGSMSYLLGINNRSELQSVYWGPRLAETDTLPRPHSISRAFEFSDTPQEFPGWGGGLYSEPALKVTFRDGNRDLVLHYVSNHIESNALSVTLRDIQREVFVTLRYVIDPQTGILARSAEISNRTKESIVIDQAAAAAWNLPRSKNYVLRYLTGRWGGEFQLQTRDLQPGATVLESRRGTTGHQFSPWFAIAENSAVNEENGRVWFGALAWSGSWRISVDQDPLQQVRIVGGFNSFDFGYALDPGATLVTPVFYGGFADHGYREASSLLHHFELAKILPHAPTPRLRPVLYNSWEATEFKVDEASQELLAEKAASIGVERFVMDDGWFGQRKDDHAGLGDWYPNSEKFPHGLKPLINKVHALGMDFGLWVEPEMVNPDSDLYRKHPDWVMNFAGRPRSEARTQMVLNLARPEVHAYILETLDKLLTENDIAFFKWDANRNWSEPGWPDMSVDKQRNLYVDYVNAYYAILKDLRAGHPKVEIESCSGGGGRVDLGVMQYTDEVWTSDNTDPFDRLLIQDGFSYAYTPAVMMAWVTDSPNWYNRRSSSLAYRFLSSMQGSLGVGANLNHWSPEDFATAKAMIANYKSIREEVQRGELYRLISPREGSNFSATESVAADGHSAVVFAFLHSQQFQYLPPKVMPRGLDPHATYSIRSLYGKLANDSPQRASGAYWMGNGLDIQLSSDYDAAAFLFERR
jgi:alpha-galactosidase